MRDFDIIVVGAGPAGLAFARGLEGSGLTVALVERQPAEVLAEPPVDGREIALTHRSVATLELLGAWNRIAPDQIFALRAARVYNGRSPLALRFDADGGPQDRLGCLVSNHLIRQSLFDAMEGQDGVTLLAGTGVEHVHADRAGARVTLADGRTLTARLLVAADSRFSAVREQLGISAEINRLGKSMLVVRLSHEKPNHGIATEWFDHRQTIAMLPLGEHMSSAVLTLKSATIERIAAYQPEILAAEIEDRFDRRLGTMQFVSGPHVYPLATTYARHFVSDSSALIGDAAVGMHPVTAHGFNLGLQSAATLAKLVRGAAQKDRPIASPLLLRRYETRHRLATRPLYSGTNLLVHLYTAESPRAHVARRAALEAAAHFAPLNTAISRMLLRH
ncbi:5-demethoxyubiquinol-8 5-hydroxylase UbiM [Citromicrobium bathyomarinum]